MTRREAALRVIESLNLNGDNVLLAEVAVHSACWLDVLVLDSEGHLSPIGYEDQLGTT